MKKIVFTLITTLYFTINIWAQDANSSQVPTDSTKGPDTTDIMHGAYGVKLGVIPLNMSGKPSYDIEPEWTNYMSNTIGIVADMRLGKHWGVQTEFNFFVNQGFLVKNIGWTENTIKTVELADTAGKVPVNTPVPYTKNGYYSESVIYNQINIPIMAKYTSGTPDSKFSWFVNGGIYMNMLLTATRKYSFSESTFLDLPNQQKIVDGGLTQDKSVVQGYSTGSDTNDVEIIHEKNSFASFTFGAALGAGAQYKVGPGRVFLEVRLMTSFTDLFNNPTQAPPNNEQYPYVIRKMDKYNPVMLTNVGVNIGYLIVPNWVKYKATPGVK
ncbi:MAG: porin family protein [Cytophagales bacterium]|nr:porin family protein [Cytophagales bacterium]